MAAHLASLISAALVAAASLTSLTLGPETVYGIDEQAALAVVQGFAGVLVPGVLARDAVHCFLGLPALLVTQWRAWRGSLAGLLLWPGPLIFVLHSYAAHLAGTPFNELFLVSATLVVLSACTTVSVIARIDRELVHRRLATTAPARALALVLLALGLYTFGQAASGTLAAAVASTVPVEPLPRPVWAADLTVKVPALLIGGVLVWRRAPLGYAIAGGLLFGFGLAPLGYAGIMALQPVLTGSPIDSATGASLLGSAVVTFVPLAFMLRGAGSGHHERL
jgi:hypothetical protein